MKTLNVLKRGGLALVAFCFMLTLANAQARYKHMPRVKVDKQAKATVVEQTPTTTAAIINTENNVAITTPVAENTTTVASTNEEVVVLETKTTSAVKHQSIVKQNKKADHNAFTKKVKENSKLMDVKDVKKTALQKWLLYMIICLAIAVLFTILAAVLAITFIYAGLYGLYVLFWIIAGLAYAAALVFLILGLTGVM
jgi:hypothetical protein